jgi:hypothetical protein
MKIFISFLLRLKYRRKNQMMDNSKAGITVSSLMYHHLQSVLGTVKLVITIRESCKPLKAININRMQFQQLYGSLGSIINNLVNVFFKMSII